MSLVYISRLDEKIDFTFRILDFNLDGFISAKDVTSLLSYINLDGMEEEHHAVDQGVKYTPQQSFTKRVLH